MQSVDFKSLLNNTAATEGNQRFIYELLIGGSSYGLQANDERPRCVKMKNVLLIGQASNNIMTLTEAAEHGACRGM